MLTEVYENGIMKLLMGKDGDLMKKRFFISFTATLVVFFVIYMIFFDSLFINNSIVDESHSELPASTDEDLVDQNSSKEDNEVLFLLCGEAEFKLTDTMMLVNVNFDTGSTSILSIPRDTKVEDKKIDKINATNSVGGMELAMSTVSELLGVDIDHYVKVDYQVVMDLVDIIGGVEIDVPFLMEYKDPTANPPLNIYIKKGLQVLDGKNAHDFLRWRHNNAKTVGYKEGDVGRVQAQQYFMRELIKQTLNSDDLIKKLPSIVITYFKNVETNLPLETILNGVKFAKNLDTENIRTETLPGEGTYIGTTSYYIHNQGQTKELVNELY